VISGDVAIENLGLSRHDEAELIENVQVIFHCAANVKFNEKLKGIVNCNTIGTLRMMELGMKMKHLQVFSYMSTIYSHCYLKELYECYYATGVDVTDVIKKTQQLSDDELELFEKNL